MIKNAARVLVEYLNTAAPEMRGKGTLLRIIGRFCKGEFVRTQYGPKIYCDFSDSTNLLAFRGRYGRKVADEVESLDYGDAFIDIGANAGIFTLLAAKSVGENGVVIAFEPQREVFAALVQNVYQNDFDNVVLFNSAVGQTTGWVHISKPDPRHTGTRFLDASGPKKILSICPSSNSLGLLEEIIGQRRITVKIDVEGAELYVLQALDQLFAVFSIEKVIVEVSERNLQRFGDSINELYNYMFDKQFSSVTPESEMGGQFDEIFVKIKDGHVGSLANQHNGTG